MNIKAFRSTVFSLILLSIVSCNEIIIDSTELDGFTSVVGDEEYVSVSKDTYIPIRQSSAYEGEIDGIYWLPNDSYEAYLLIPSVYPKRISYRNGELLFCDNNLYVYNI